MHEAFELVFVAAHFGTRLLAGLVVLAALWGGTSFLRARATHGGGPRRPWREATASD